MKKNGISLMIFSILIRVGIEILVKINGSSIVSTVHDKDEKMKMLAELVSKAMWFIGATNLLFLAGLIMLVTAIIKSKMKNKQETVPISM